ncbi:hypothetical protein BDW22DRAFT_1485432 [Trametopsis cervina]|nr:hypothetical protein BDW22DRAFT_1485432 [Trametopsis cervina]
MYGSRHKRKGKKGSSQPHHDTTFEAVPPEELASTMSSSADLNTRITMALMVGMSSGTFHDTKFLAFSRRKNGGGVERPLPIYANSSLVIAAAPHFMNMLQGEFREGQLRPLYEELSPDEKSMDDYDYSSDSDLDDEESELLEDDGNSNDSGYDDGHTGQSDSASGAQGTEAKPKEASSNSEQDTHTSSLPMHSPGVQYGRIITLSTGAYRTWKALIPYLYHGQVKFANLRSHPVQTKAKELPEAFTPCSPKSIYRLADMYNLPKLKAEALENIKSQLTPKNIVQELRSSLTFHYDEIQRMEVIFACEGAQRTAVLEGLSEWMSDLSKGQYSHTKDTLHALVQEIAGSKPIQNRCRHCNRTDVSFRCSSCNNYNTF